MLLPRIPRVFIAYRQARVRHGPTGAHIRPPIRTGIVIIGQVHHLRHALRGSRGIITRQDFPGGAGRPFDGHVRRADRRAIGRVPGQDLAAGTGRIEDVGIGIRIHIHLTLDGPVRGIARDHLAGGTGGARDTGIGIKPDVLKPQPHHLGVVLVGGQFQVHRHIV